ncbi:MAG: tripartite tricarboxylate transporter TctB family protein [Treponema sp.]|jgi:hypothetical protein|nr:tripartite tricarboxylate transporter TctB family protein [Treponema sp.]
MTEERKDTDVKPEKAAKDEGIAGIDAMTGTEHLEGKEHLDFAASVILMAVCVFALVLSWGYYLKSKAKFYASPGFMPIIIAGSLFIMALVLFLKSIKGSSVKQRFFQILEALPGGLKSKRFLNSLVALGMFGVYTYVLLPLLPFWLSSFIVLLASLLYLKASTVIKCIIIAAISIGGIVLLFQVAFRVPMP